VVDAVCAAGTDLYLFIDDYHHVEDASTHALIQGLLDHGPDELHLVLASRTAPPLAVSRMRMTGELAEITFPDLPFDFQETQHFLQRQLGEVAPDDARLIHDITDGWPVCVQMICIRLKRSPTSRAVLSELLHRQADLERYLAEDVVQDLPPNLADFLEKISVCRRFNADLARHVTGEPRARTLLDQIERDNLFMLPVEFDSPTPWYRLHPLFANFLQDRLAQRDPKLLREVHTRASRWFGEQGLLIEALRHAYHGDDLEAAARLVEGAPPINSMSFIGTLQRWMDQLPAERLLAHPRLLLLGCWALVAVCRWREAQAWLDRLQPGTSALAPEFALQERHLRASIALQRDDTEAALCLIAPSDFDALTDRFVRQAHLAVLGFAYCAAGRYGEARALHGCIAARLPRGELDDDMTLVAESNLLLSHLLEGDNREAMRVGSALVVRAEAAHGRRSVSAINSAAYLSDAFYEADRLVEAREVLTHRLDLLRFTSPEPMMRAVVVHARLLALQHSGEEALRGLAEDEARCREQQLDRPLAQLLAEQARLQLRRNERDAVRKLQNELDRLAACHRGGTGFAAEIGAIAALAGARLAQASIDWQGMLARVDDLRQHGLAYGRLRIVALADLLSGVALRGLGRDAESVARLTAGVEVARNLGLVRTLMDEGEPLRQALEQLQQRLAAGAAKDYLVEVLRRPEPAPAARPSADAPDLQGEALKPREIEILRLVGQSMANKRIALTLNLTLETVKWNLKTAFAKLGVSSRYDALIAARKRGLIE
jgi:LuxR family maltose regulon positive regulatory protein